MFVKVSIDNYFILTLSFCFRSICRYDLHRQATELQRLKDYVDKKALIEGTEMEKVVEVEVAKV